MLTLQQIIDESDILVPNGVSVTDKVVQLNAINADFFNVVKIPKLNRFSSTTAADYVLPVDVRQKNIDMVQVGLLRYRNLDADAVTPIQNRYSFDDVVLTLTLSPAPYQVGLACICRYRRIATTTFVSGTLTASPDAPEEYNWTYIPALAAWLAKAEDDTAKASLYEQQYKDAWNVAAQGYAT